MALQQQRPRLTPEAARSFETFSVPNATILDRAARTRGCACLPYQDWFTLRRWNAQGFKVRKGEHGESLQTFVSKFKKDEDTGEEKVVGQRQVTTYVFCRCQVETTPIKEKP